MSEKKRPFHAPRSVYEKGVGQTVQPVGPCKISVFGNDRLDSLSYVQLPMDIPYTLSGKALFQCRFKVGILKRKTRTQETGGFNALAGQQKRIGHFTQGKPDGKRRDRNNSGTVKNAAKSFCKC